MFRITPSQHAARRLAQRGIPRDDADLIVELGSEVRDGYMITKRDAQRFEAHLRRLIARLSRLEGKLAVVRGGVLVTAFHAADRQRKRQMREVA